MNKPKLFIFGRICCVHRGKELIEKIRGTTEKQKHNISRRVNGQI